MQIAHQLHSPLRSHVDSGIFKLQFGESQICQGDDATQEMASDFRVRPVPDREDADQIVVLGLPERFSHKISVQAGLIDRVSAPIVKIRDQNIHTKPVDIPAYAVTFFAESQGNTSVFALIAQVVQILS